MVTKSKIAGLILATAVVLNSPILVWADNGVSPASSHQEGDWHQKREIHMMAKVLNLSEDQEKQLKDIKQKQKEAKKSIFEQMKANRVSFETEIVKASPDMGKINDLQAQLKTIQAQMVDNHLSSILNIKKLLTPEQFAGYMALEKAEDMMKEKRHQFGHKDGARDGHKNWGDKGDDGDRGHSSDD